MRAHRCPEIVIKAGPLTSTTVPRQRSLLTGASSAALFAKIPVEDVFLKLDSAWRARGLGFCLDSARLSLLAWADNIFTYDAQADRAISMMEEFEAILRADWHCHNTHIAISKRVATLDSIAVGMIRARACCWPPDQATFKRLDAMQSNAIRWMLQEQPQAGDTPQAFRCRQNGNIGRARGTPWSFHAALALVTWICHMQRHPEEPASWAMATHDWQWLSSQREHASTGRDSRTATRSGRAKVYRYDNCGWIDALCLGGTDDPRRHRAAATQLLSLFNARRAPAESPSDFL